MPDGEPILCHLNAFASAVGVLTRGLSASYRTARQLGGGGSVDWTASAESMWRSAVGWGANDVIQILNIMPAAVSVGGFSGVGSRARHDRIRQPR